MDTAKVLEVIETTLSRRGEGKTLEDPIRVLTEYWSLDGKLLATVDSWAEKERVEHREVYVQRDRAQRQEIARLGEIIDGAQGRVNQLNDEKCRIQMAIWREIAPLVSVARTFVKRCEIGEVRSKKSRAAFENALKHLSEGLLDYVKEKEEGK